MNALTKIETVDHIPDVLKELEEAFYDIPFENSDFQNKMFVVADQLTPARAYRAIGLRMFAKISQLISIAAAMAIQTQAAYTKLWDKKGEIDAIINDTDAVDRIVW